MGKAMKENDDLPRPEQSHEQQVDSGGNSNAIDESLLSLIDALNTSQLDHLIIYATQRRDGLKQQEIDRDFVQEFEAQLEQLAREDALENERLWAEFNQPLPNDSECGQDDTF
jgi:hypothetical protein